MTDMESRETGKIVWETNVATKNEGPNICFQGKSDSVNIKIYKRK